MDEQQSHHGEVVVDNLAVLQFEPFTSVFTTAFWRKLGQLKLDQLKLDERPIPLFGQFSPGRSFNSGDSIPPARLFFDHDSFIDAEEPANGVFGFKGQISLLNTLEAFKKVDKLAISNKWHQTILGLFHKQRELLSFCSVLSQFLWFEGIIFADLKRYRYYHHLCYPTLAPTTAQFRIQLNEPISPPTHAELWKQKGIGSPIGFFVLDETTEKACRLDLVDDCMFTSADSAIVHLDCSNHHNVADWSLRHFLFAFKLYFPNQETVKIILLRQDVQSSRKLVIRLPALSLVDSMLMLGWERNAQDKIAPSVLDLSSVLDPIQLAKEASELNLKLIKWRILPTLDLEKIASQKCLLFGAGTLGCNVTRCLLGWGIKNITLVDNGKVSYSNPVRQSLFIHKDCTHSNNKAMTAAKRASEIDPSSNVKGVELTIPMPGHYANAEVWEQDYVQLEELIQSHQVLFLLTDSRESRWLPSLLGAAYGKIVITAALGFDSWVVMRHGAVNITDKDQERNVGCYFCSDNIGPRDTMSDRTLDQQCTVSRPGSSYMAASTAVELLASLLQHPLGPLAPPSKPCPPTEYVVDGAVLGAIPHQIRGSLGHFQNIILTGQAYSGCIACSHAIVDAYRKDGVSFVQRAIEDPDSMWKVTRSSPILDYHDNAFELDCDEYSDDVVLCLETDEPLVKGDVDSVPSDCR